MRDPIVDLRLVGEENRKWIGVARVFPLYVRFEAKEGGSNGLSEGVFYIPYSRIHYMKEIGMESDSNGK